LSRINLLNEETSNKIAAGEVVERPFSVVKELVENSIDASAKNVSIEISDGGQKSIKITDDGTGIHPEDIQKAFLPHATSKIQAVEDIYKITSMGFRGEALASIAAVSNTILKSKTKEFDFGKEISVLGGISNYIKDCGMNVGTSIEVNDLFYNVPARLKFMKSTVREGAAITDIINRIAISHSDMSFKLINNGKQILQTYGTGNVSDSIRSIYGKSISENIIAFQNHNDIASAHGFVGNSEISRGSRNNQSIFVNGRYIKSKLITAAVENAFKSFLMINKFPFFVLFLDIFPEFLDVNIHPTKSEVKFRDDREIFKLVFDGVHRAIKESLKDTFSIQEEKGSSSFKEDNYENMSYFDNNKETAVKEIYNNIDIPIDLHSEIKEKQAEIEEVKQVVNNLNLMDELPITVNRVYESNHEIKPSKVNVWKSIESDDEINSIKKSSFPKLEVIGQFNKTFILCQAINELYIIDQHAAHEKILFEKYMKDIEKRDITVQLLLTPAVIELSTEDYYYFIENKELFKSTGFDIEIFGDNTITVREVPYILGKLNIKNFILDILDNLKNMGTGKTIDVKYDSIAKMACKSAIKANDELSGLEIEALIKKLALADDPFNCPHGRPTIIKITLNELEKRFKRIQ
jgi:DNA mismatch repair protein MutL